MSLTLSDIRNFIRQNCADVGTEHYYIGKLDSKKDKSVGIYQSKSQNINHTAVGNKPTTLTLVKNTAILIHWTNKANDTEDAALLLYSDLQNLRGKEIGGNYILDYIHLEENEPVDVSTDENGIYERVIDCSFYYHKK